MENAHIVVTGAAGFIGHHTASRLLDLGHTVVGVDAFTDYYDVSLKRGNAERLESREGFSMVEGSLTPELCEAVFDGADAVLHLAAQPGVRDSWVEFDLYVDRNIRATKHVLDAALAAGVQRVACASSSSVYGDALQVPTTEEAPTEPRSPYGITKLASERLAVAYALERGLPTVLLRYFTVYGPRQRPDMAIQRLIQAAFDGTVFPLYGDGSQLRDFTFIDDVVDANIRSLFGDATPGAVYNVCGSAPVALSDVIDLVERTTGHQVHIDRREVAVGDVSRTEGCNERIRRDLGWEPKTPILVGIERHVAAVRDRRARAMLVR